VGARGRRRAALSAPGVVAGQGIDQRGGDHLGRGGSALVRHPRIGERASGDPGDVALSAAEQSGVSSSDAAALAAGNAAYEERFGYIYLICASGLSGEQMLAALRERLTHDDAAERLVVMDELRKIAALRLAKAITP